MRSLYHRLEEAGDIGARVAQGYSNHVWDGAQREPCLDQLRHLPLRIGAGLFTLPLYYASMAVEAVRPRRR